MEIMLVKYEEGSGIYSEGLMEGDKLDEEGLSTNLRPKSKSAMKVSDHLERFLTQVKRELFL